MTHKKRIGKILGVLLNILLIIVSIIILIGIYYIFQIKVLNNDYANIFGYTFFEVATGSMSPTIEVGDVVIVKVTKDVNEDEIIVYKEDDNFITHRLVKREDGKLITKGDANNSEDVPVDEENVLGKVEKIIPKIGTWRKVILSPEVVGLAIVLIIILIISYIYTSKMEGKDD